MFPKNNLLPNTENPLLSMLNQKSIGFSPLVFCEFYQGFQVLQIQGIETKEYIFGNYFNGKYSGHIYFGDVLSQTEVAKICELYMPKYWHQIKDYVILHCEKTWYYKFHQSQYAFVLENVLQKVS